MAYMKIYNVTYLYTLFLRGSDPLGKAMNLRLSQAV